MAGRRINMRKTRELLRLHLVGGMSRRQIAACCGLGKTVVSGHIRRVQEMGLSWDDIEKMPGEKLEELLYGESCLRSVAGYAQPKWEEVAKELRKKGVTRQLLWEEYREGVEGKSYSYSQFCELYSRWKAGVDPVMHFEHVAGEKCFVDYSGMKLRVIDPETGEVRDAEVFVAALGASNYTFADVTWSQTKEEFVGSHQRAVEFFGGVPRIFVLDNLKSGVKKADWYEPELNGFFNDFLYHLGAVGIPGRPRKPRDKAKVENAVLQVERRVLAPLRNRTLIGLEEARTEVMEQIFKLNARPFQKMEGSRESLFEELDKPALQILPSERWTPTTWKRVKVHIDYHVEISKHYFSVPYQYIGQELEAKITQDLVEIFRKGKVVATHQRTRSRYTTNPEHMPSSHREYRDWDPPRLVVRAKEIGPCTAELIDRILLSKHHPEQGYRPCLGIVRLAKRFSEERLERACRRALVHSSFSYRAVKSILQKGLDQIEEDPDPTPPVGQHDNIRGAAIYAEGGQQC